jgi:dienelactone hydrolase
MSGAAALRPFAFLSTLLLPVPAQVPTDDARNTEIPGTDTHFRMPEYRTLSEWEARRRDLRDQILFAAGLEPMPPKPPLRAEVFGRITQKDYSIDKVLLETRPGYWLGGNLYRPVGRAGKFPAVASPHGHWNYGRLEHGDLGSIPARCINLARQGYIVFAYDMVGYNDTIQTPHAFGGKIEQLWNFGPLGLQLWNSIRVVDYLASLDEVDAARIGATGASGGGTQTFLLTAVDERVKFSAPVNMISAIMQGGSPCENAPGLRTGAFNVEFGAMMAPRPLLMVSATGDWTKNTLEEEFPAIKRIYELYGKAEMVEAVRIQAPHNYNRASREAMYRFFAKHALGDTDTAKYEERGIRPEKLQDMLALHNRALPAGALNYEGLLGQWQQWVRQQTVAVTDPEERRRLLRLAIGASWPGRVIDKVEGESIVISRPTVRDRVPGVWMPGKGRAALVIHPDGANAAKSSPRVRELTSAGRPVLLIDAFQTGSAVTQRNRSHGHFLTFNRSDDQLRVQDILTALRWLESKGSGPVDLIGLGRAAVWCHFAAALAPGKAKLDAGTNFQGTDQEFIDQFFVPGIRRAGGWAAAKALNALQ